MINKHLIFWARIWSVYQGRIKKGRPDNNGLRVFLNAVEEPEQRIRLRNPASKLQRKRLRLSAAMKCLLNSLTLKVISSPHVPRRTRKKANRSVHHGNLWFDQIFLAKTTNNINSCLPLGEFECEAANCT